MKIDYDGQVYDLDLENFTLKQAMAIQSYTGMPILRLVESLKGVEEDSPELFKAVGALYWLMHNQAGHQFPIADTDFPLVPFLTALFTAMAADEDASGSVPVPEAEPGPTAPSPASSPSPPDPPSPPPSLPQVTSPSTGS